MEQLVQAYAASVGTSGPGVPAELLQGAVRIEEAKARIQHRGPSDAVASDEEEEQGAGEPAQPDEAAVVIDGGVDDVSRAVDISERPTSQEAAEARTQRRGGMLHSITKDHSSADASRATTLGWSNHAWLSLSSMTFAKRASFSPW